MPNPKAPRVHREGRETRGGVDLFTERLRILGATPDEVRMVRENWDTDTDDWDDKARAKVAHVSDVALTRMLDQVRADFPFEPDHTVEPVEQEANTVVMGVDILPPAPPVAPTTAAAPESGAQEAAQAAQEPPEGGEPITPTPDAADPQEDAQGTADGEPEGADPMPPTDSPIHVLETWVGDDPGRARQVLDAEQADAASLNQDPRKTLVAKMERVIEAAADAG